MAELTKDLIQTEYVDKQRSFGEIAKDLGTYVNKVRRFAIKEGFKVRDAGEAQKISLKRGVRKHPTAGTVRSEATKAKISDSVAQGWEDMSAEQREKMRLKSKENWAARPRALKEQMQDKATKALLQAAKHGSKLERYVLNKLREAGYVVEFHRISIVSAEKLETDFYIPELKTVIEIDGVSHYENIHGHDVLAKQQRNDAIKNGLLLQAGYIVVRVKHNQNSDSQKYQRDRWLALNAALEEIKKGNVPERLIYVN